MEIMSICTIKGLKLDHSSSSAREDQLFCQEFLPHYQFLHESVEIDPSTQRRCSPVCRRPLDVR